jgi:glycine cleavage system regulatory protein
MTQELPENLRSLDNQLLAALGSYAPPRDLDQRIVSHVSHRSRLRLTPTPWVVKTAAAVVAIGLLGTFGYLGNEQLNPQTASSLATIVDSSGSMQFRTAVIQREEEMRTWSLLTDGKDSGQLSQGGKERLSELTEKSSERGAIEDRLKSASETNDSTRLPTDKELETKLELRTEQLTEARRYSGQQEGASEGKHLGPATNAPAPVSRIPDFSNAPDFSLSDAKSKQGANKALGGEGGGGGGGAGGKGAADMKFEYDHRNSVDVPATPPADHFKPGQSNDVGKLGLKDPPPLQKAQEEQKKNSEPVITPKPPASPPTNGAGAPPTVVQAPEAPPAVVRTQKVIRSGNVEFEVDSFDTALMTITKLVVEQGGFVASTDSAKLANGKMRGSITLRVPPDRLDTFVLMLRGIGDLKAQKISAQDVSKQYTDVESGLKAARAMEDRLLEMIRTGQGAIKDLLAAEKELGVWREKIEKYEGEKRYYDNLIGLSTLTVTLQERDIKASSASIETETVSAGLETDDVDKARADLLKAIDDAKGRVITSDMKKLDAGQFAATIVAELPPDRAGPVIDRLKQLGKVARLDVDRRQTSVDGTTPPIAGAQIEKKPTTIHVSIYNLANVAPRLTTTATIAADDVETKFKQVMAQVEKVGGRVVTSSLQHPQANSVIATMQIEVPAAQAAEVSASLPGIGEVMNLQLNENPDTANVTTAKQGYTLRIISAATVAPRFTTTATIASEDVEAQFKQVIAQVEKIGGRVINSNLQRPQANSVIATMQIEVPSAQAAEMSAALPGVGEVMNLQLTENRDTANVISAKQGYALRIVSAATVTPRQTTTLQLASKDVVTAHQSLFAMVTEAKGRILQSSVVEGDRDNITAILQVEVPRAALAEWEKAQKLAGDVLTRQVTRSNDTQNTLDTKVALNVSLYASDRLPPRQTTNATLRVDNAETTQAAYIAMADQLGGRVIDQNVSRDSNGCSSARVVMDIPRDKATTIIQDMRSSGEIWSMNTSTNAQAPDGALSRARFELQLTEADALIGNDDGIWSSITAGLSTSLRGLALSVQLIVIGVCLVAPWMLIVWGAYKLSKRFRKSSQPSQATVA